MLDVLSLMFARPKRVKMHQKIKKWAIYGITLFLVGTGCSTHETRVTDGSAMADPKRDLLSRSEQILQALQMRYDSVSQMDELDALRIKNTRQELETNLRLMAALEDQYRQHPNESELAKELGQDIQIQVDYIETLIAASEAILRGNSLSFGTWEGVPNPSDSLSTPVGGSRK
jgi:hypothetical protein